MRRLSPALALLLLGCPSEEECAPRAVPGPTPVQHPAGRVRAWQVWIHGDPGGAIGPGERFTRLSLSVEAPEPVALVHEAPGTCGQVGCSAAHRRRWAEVPVGAQPVEGMTLLGRTGDGPASFELTAVPRGRLVLIRLGALEDPTATLTTHAWAQASACGASPTVGVLAVHAGSAQCGDGLRDGAETCDDGNAVEGDGCSSGALTPNPSVRTCQVEAPTCDPARAGGWQAWACQGEPSRCEPQACFGADAEAAGQPCRMPALSDAPDHTVIPLALGRLTEDAAPSADPLWLDTGAARAPCPLAPAALAESPACTVRGHCPLLRWTADTSWRGCTAAGGTCTLRDPTTAQTVLAARPVGPRTATLVEPVADPASSTARNANALRVRAAFGHTLSMNRSGHLTMRRADGQTWWLPLSPSVEALTPRPDGGAWVAARLRQRYFDGRGEHVEPVPAGDGLVVQPIDPEGRPGRPQVFGREGALSYGALLLAALPAHDGAARALVGLSGTASGEAWLLGIRADGRPGVDRGLGDGTRLTALEATSDGAVVAVQAWGAVDGQPAEPGATLLGLSPTGATTWRAGLPGDPNRAGRLAWAPGRLVWLGPAEPGAAWIEVDPADGAVLAQRPLDLRPCAPLLGLVPADDGGLLVARAHCQAADVAAVTRLDRDGAVAWVERLAGVEHEVSAVGLTGSPEGPLLWGRFTGPQGVSDRVRLAP